jgi:beta-lactamase class A
MTRQASASRLRPRLSLALVASLLVCRAGGFASQSSVTLSEELRRVLDRQLESIVEALDGVLGYSALDLTSGEEIGRLDQQDFPTASAIKLAVLYEAFRQADEGTLDLDAPSPLDRTQVAGGDGILRALGTPVLAWRDHAVLMIALSDNTASNILIEKTTMRKVNARMQSLGLGAIRLRRKMMDAAAAARGEENVATPRGLSRLLRVLHSGEGLRGETHRGLLKVLEAGAAGWLRRGVPADVQVLSKLGTLEGVRVDAAIVRAPHRPYALTVMTTYLKDEGEGERAIAAVSRAVYGYFSRLGMGSEYGRQSKRPPAQLLER